MARMSGCANLGLVLATPLEGRLAQGPADTESFTLKFGNPYTVPAREPVGA